MSTSTYLTVSGSLSEAAGLGLVYWQARVLRRDELGETGWMRRIADEVKRTINNPASQPIGPMGIASAESGGGLSVVTGEITETPEEGVDRLGEELKKTVTKISELEKSLLQIADEMRTGIDELNKRRKSDIDDATKTELFGAFFFILGVGLTIAGAVA